MHDAGANQYTFHIEATKDAAALARNIREVGMKVRLNIKILILFNLELEIGPVCPFIPVYKINLTSVLTQFEF